MFLDSYNLNESRKKKEFRKQSFYNSIDNNLILRPQDERDKLWREKNKRRNTQKPSQLSYS